MSIPLKFATDSAVLLPRPNGIAVEVDTAFSTLKGGLRPSARRVVHIAEAMSVDFDDSFPPRTFYSRCRLLWSQY